MVFELHVFCLFGLEQRRLELVVHRRRLLRVHIDETLERLPYCLFGGSLDKDFTWILFLEGEGGRDGHLVCHFFGAFVVCALVEDGLNQFFLLAHLAPQDEHAVIGARGCLPMGTFPWDDNLTARPKSNCMSSQRVHFIWSCLKRVHFFSSSLRVSIRSYSEQWLQYFVTM